MPSKMNVHGGAVDTSVDNSLGAISLSGSESPWMKYNHVDSESKKDLGLESVSNEWQNT